MNLPTSNSKKQLILQYTFIGIIALTIGIYFRLYPLLSFSSNDSSEKATVLVIAKLKKQFAKQVDDNYPHLSKQQKNVLAKKLFDDTIKKEGLKVRGAIDKVTQSFNQSNGDDQKTPYLLASDSFYYYALTENILNTGKISDKVKGSKYLNELMLAPHGHWEPINFHPFIGAFIYNTLKIFNPNVTLMYAVSFTPILITALALIPFLFICHLFGLRQIETFAGAVFFLLAPIFIRRSTFGWYDNDPYNTLFPLLILSALFLSLQKINNKKIFWLALFCTILFIFLYTFFWHGWMFIFSVLFIAAIFSLAYYFFILKEKPQTKQLLGGFSFIFIGSFLAISLSFGKTEFFTLFSEGWIALKNFLTPQLSAWPDLYISVGELKKASIVYITQTTGGPLFCGLAVTGSIYLLYLLLIRSKKIPAYQSITLIALLALSIFIATGAQRFAILCLVPLGLLFPIGIHAITNTLLRILKRLGCTPEKKIFYHGSQTIIALLVVASIFVPIQSINASIQMLLNPIYNQTWEKSLLQIKKQTPPDSIINTWWPPGHFIKSIAHRKVTFDGATINYPQAYWMSNVFLSQTEEEALGILRMLNNSGNQAVEYLQGLGLNLSSSVLIIKEITKVNILKAYIIASKVIKEKKQILHLLTLTHRTPPPSYCLIYRELMENNLQFAFIGRWNFKKIEIINENPELLAQIPNRNSDEYVQFLWELAGGADKYSGPLVQVSLTNNIALFENNVRINLNNYDCHIDSKKFGKGIPRSILYIEDNKVKEKVFDGGNLNYSVLLVKYSNHYEAILLEPSLAHSLLVKLYVFKGHGLKYFKPMISEADLTKRTTIYVYEINWDQFHKDTKPKNPTAIPTKKPLGLNQEPFAHSLDVLNSL